MQEVECGTAGTVKAKCVATVASTVKVECAVAGTVEVECALAGTFKLECAPAGTVKLECALAGTVKLECALASTVKVECAVAGTTAGAVKVPSHLPHAQGMAHQGCHLVLHPSKHSLVLLHKGHHDVPHPVGRDPGLQPTPPLQPATKPKGDEWGRERDRGGQGSKR